MSEDSDLDDYINIGKYYSSGNNKNNIDSSFKMNVEQMSPSWIRQTIKTNGNSSD